MAGGNRNQRQAAKATRRKQAVAAKQQAERVAASLPARIAVAAASPLERCLRTADLASAGIGHVLLAKRLPSGALGCGFFLVDLLCLGAKDAFYREMAPSDFEEHLSGLAEEGQRLVPIDPASAKAVLRDAVAFAAESGLSPAKGYAAAMGIFDGVDAAGAQERFPLGRDGKVIYVPSSGDSYAKIREIERVLTRTRGDGWDADPMHGMPFAQRMAIRGTLDALARAKGGPAVEREAEAEPAAEQP